MPTKRRVDGARHLLLIPFAPGVGDMVMMEPLLRAVRFALPDWRVTLVARDYAADLLPAELCEVASPRYFVTRAPTPLRPLLRFIPQRAIAWAAEPAMALDLGPFERVINLFFAWESKAPFESWWTPSWPLQEGVRHALDLLADHLEGELEMRIPEADRLPRLEVFPKAADWATRYLKARRVSGRPVATLVVSAVNSLKWWTVPNWAELNERLSQLGWRTLLVAPKEDVHARQTFDACRSKPLWPHVGIRQMTALLARSGVVIGVDTGPLHVAASLGIPWVGLFGPTNPDLVGPYDRSGGRAVVAHFAKPHSCKDCWLAFKNRADHCPTLPSTGCTTLIPVDEVIEAVEALGCGTRIASAANYSSEHRRGSKAP